MVEDRSGSYWVYSLPVILDVHWETPTDISHTGNRAIKDKYFTAILLQRGTTHQNGNSYLRE